MNGLSRVSGRCVKISSVAPQLYRSKQYEKGKHLHRRCLQGQSGPRRLGNHPRLRRARKGAVGRGSDDHEQPHGADGGHLGSGGIA